MTTADELISALQRLQVAASAMKENILRFMRGCGEDIHPEGSAWLSIMETNLTVTYNSLGYCISALSDCYFVKSQPHIKMAHAQIRACRYICEHVLQCRRLYIPDEYLMFISDTNGTLADLSGYLAGAEGKIALLINPPLGGII